MNTTKKRLGELLVDAGVVSTKMIDDALQKKKEGQKLGDYLVENGLVVESILFEQLSKQLKIPLYNLQETDINVNVLDKIPRNILFEVSAFPVELTGSLLSVAMSDPLDDISLKKLSENCPYDISPVLATKTDITDYISKYYSLDHSMRDLFGDSTASYDDMNDLQISDMFYSLLRKQGTLHMVAIESKSTFILKRTNAENLSSNDTKYIMNFLKKLVGYTKDKNTFSHTLHAVDGTVVSIQLSVIRKPSQDEFWLHSAVLERVQETTSTINTKLATVSEPGLYVLYNPNYMKLPAYMDALRTYSKDGNRLLLLTNDVALSNAGVNTLDTSLENIANYLNFADTFVLDAIWDLTTVDAVLQLLKAQKKVVLHVPFPNEESLQNYLNVNNLYEILESFIVQSITL